MNKYEQQKRDTRPWIGVDLDGTLAFHDQMSHPDHIGKPIDAMLKRVNDWISEGKRIKIMTARASLPEQIPLVKEWLNNNNLPDLEVTNEKDFMMIELWDDRAIQVIPNKGIPITANETQSEKVITKPNFFISFIRSLTQGEANISSKQRVKLLHARGHEVKVLDKKIFVNQTFNLDNLKKDILDMPWLLVHCAKCNIVVYPPDLDNNSLDFMGRISCQNCLKESAESAK